MSALQRLLERVGHLDHQGRWVIGLVEGADFTEEARAALAEAGGNANVLQRVMRCRYEVHPSINRSGFGWDTSRLNEVIKDLQSAPAPNDGGDTARLAWLLPNLHPANFGLKFPGGYKWADEAEFLSKWRAAIDAALINLGCAFNCEWPTRCCRIGDGLGGNVCMLRRRGTGSCQSWCRDSDTCPPGVSVSAQQVAPPAGTDEKEQP